MEINRDLLYELIGELVNMRLHNDNLLEKLTELTYITDLDDYDETDIVDQASEYFDEVTNLSDKIFELFYEITTIIVKTTFSELHSILDSKLDDKDKSNVKIYTLSSDQYGEELLGYKLVVHSFDTLSNVFTVLYDSNNLYSDYYIYSGDREWII